MNAILFVDLPGFYTRAHQAHEPRLSHRPLIVHRDGVVVDLCRRAVEFGLSAGMKLTEARTLCSELSVCSWEPEVYEPMRRTWLDIGTDYADRIESTLPGSAFFDLSPHPQPSRIALRFLERLESSGWDVRAALAPVRWIAESLCPHTGFREVSNPLEALRREPIERLTPVPSEIRRRLAFLGYHRIGALRAIPIETLFLHFGELAYVIHQAAHGLALEEVRNNYPAACLSTRRIEPDGIHDRSSLEAHLRALAQCLALQLCERDWQGNRLELTLSNGVDLERRYRTFSQSIQSATSLEAGLRLLTQDPPRFQPLQELRLRMPDLKKAHRRQIPLNGLIRHDPTSAELALNRIQAKFGAHSVRKASEIPEPRRKRVLKVWSEITGWS